MEQRQHGLDRGADRHLPGDIDDPLGRREDPLAREGEPLDRRDPLADEAGDFARRWEDVQAEFRKLLPG